MKSWNELLKQAITWQYPNEIPVSFGMLPAAWIKNGPELVRLAREYPDAEMIPIGKRASDRYGGTSLLAETFGFDCDIAGAYPGWSFAEESPIRDTFIASYRELFDADLKIEAIHAGLECGLFSDALPGLDAIAVGPTIRGCHTPDEYLPLDSFERFYSLLTDVLSRLAKH